MHAGELDKQITIQVRTQTQDDAGQPIETWATFATVYASIEPLTGKEYFASNQIVGERAYLIKIRYRRGIKSKMRAVYLKRYFEIAEPPIDFKERREWLYLKCKEVVEG